MNNKLQITAAIKNERTILKNCFFTQPFRVVNITEDRSDNRLFLMVMSSSPGLLNNDRYDIDIHVEPGAVLILQSQAYQRVFNMKGSASICQNINVGNRGTLLYTPHPVVPHKGSTLKSETNIYLADSSRMVFGDILTCGRKHSGEIFQFASFNNRISVQYGNRMIYKDNIVLDTAVCNTFNMGQFEGYTHQAGFLIADMREKINDSFLDPIIDMINKELCISFGITRVSENLVAGRILGTGAEQLYQLLKQVENIAGSYWNNKVNLKTMSEKI